MEKKINQRRILELVPGYSLFPVIIYWSGENEIWRDPLLASILVFVALLGLLLVTVGLLENKTKWPLFPYVAYTSVHLFSLVPITFVLMRVCLFPIIMPGHLLQ